MQFDHCRDQAQAETNTWRAATGVAAIKTIKYFFLFAVRNAGPIIGDRNFNQLLSVTYCINGDDAMQLAKLERVVDQIPNRLCQQHWVSGHHQRSLRLETQTSPL